MQTFEVRAPLISAAVTWPLARRIAEDASVQGLLPSGYELRGALGLDARAVSVSGNLTILPRSVFTAALTEQLDYRRRDGGQCDTLHG